MSAAGSGWHVPEVGRYAGLGPDDGEVPEGYGTFTLAAQITGPAGELWHTKVEITGEWATPAGIVAAYVKLGNELADELAARSRPMLGADHDPTGP
jgi:hypothetical protein